MAQNIRLERRENENSISLIRRFSRRMSSSGIINRVKSIRYNERNTSDYKRKKQALTSMKRQEEYQQLVKLGKVADPSQRN